MNKMNESLESLLATTFKTITMFEQDSSVIAVLKQPEVVDQIMNQRKIEERFRSVTNSLFISSPPVFYTIVDLLGNVYTSFPPAQRLNYEAIQAKPGLKARYLPQHRTNGSWKAMKCCLMLIKARSLLLFLRL